MRSVVQALGARGHALHYLSNMPAPYAQHLERAHDVVGWFRSGVFSSRVGMIKPEAAIFAHASRVFGIEPHDTLLIDDNEANVLAARRAGWQALRFESAAQCRRSLSGAGLLA
jgi:putative hydrolase of the HAD superfamily